MIDGSCLQGHGSSCYKQQSVTDPVSCDQTGPYPMCPGEEVYDHSNLFCDMILSQGRTLSDYILNLNELSWSQVWAQPLLLFYELGVHIGVFRASL